MANYVPISDELHRNKHWLQHTSIAFAKSDTVAPLLISELPSALHSMPIAFVKQNERFVLVVVMGLTPQQNLFVSPEGAWLSDYLPPIYRSSPFQLLSIKEDQSEQALCIDEGYICDVSEGEPIFNEDGTVTEVIGKIFEMVREFHTKHQITQNICQLLAKHNLIEPWNLVLNDGDQQSPVEGLYRISESALNSLADEDFLALKKTNALTTAYAQLFSMQKISTLAQLLKQRSLRAAEPNGPSNDTETFNFSGL